MREIIKFLFAWTMVLLMLVFIGINAVVFFNFFYYNEVYTDGLEFYRVTSRLITWLRGL